MLLQHFCAALETGTIAATDGQSVAKHHPRRCLAAEPLPPNIFLVRPSPSSDLASQRTAGPLEHRPPPGVRRCRRCRGKRWSALARGVGADHNAGRRQRSLLMKGARRRQGSGVERGRGSRRQDGGNGEPQRPGPGRRWRPQHCPPAGRPAGFVTCFAANVATCQCTDPSPRPASNLSLSGPES